VPEATDKTELFCLQKFENRIGNSHFVVKYLNIPVIVLDFSVFPPICSQRANKN